LIWVTAQTGLGTTDLNNGQKHSLVWIQIWYSSVNVKKINYSHLIIAKFDEVWFSGYWLFLFRFPWLHFPTSNNSVFVILDIIATLFLLFNLTKLIFCIFNWAASTSFRLGLLKQQPADKGLVC